MKENNIVLTGGHAGTTALAVIREIKKKDLPWKIYWIGPRRAMEGRDVATLESNVFPEYKVIFKPIFSGRIQRKFTRYTIPSIFKIPMGFIHALILLTQIRPKVILSFGGYAAFPVVVVGWLLRIPIVIHEQTAAVGRANKYSSFFATKIALAREESLKYFPNKKCVVTGNPILPEILKVSPKETLSDPPVIFVTGGSRGSLTINGLVGGILERLLKDYQVIQQTGSVDYEKYAERKKELKQELGNRYEVFANVVPQKMTDLLEEADIVVARAGANTVSELIAAKKMAILVPIPFSYMDEQTKNAFFAQRLGVARVLPQSEATPERLLSEIKYLLDSWEKVRKSVAKPESPDKDAASKVVELMLRVLKK